MDTPKYVRYISPDPNEFLNYGSIYKVDKETTSEGYYYLEDIPGGWSKQRFEPWGYGWHEGEKKPVDTQVAGDHYKKLAIQPIEYIMANNLDPLQANVIKYVTRHKDKGGRQDVEKAIHYLNLILHYQYGEEE